MHHRFDPGMQDILLRDVQPSEVLQPYTSILAELHNLRPKIDDTIGMCLHAHDIALKAHVTYEEQFGE